MSDRPLRFLIGANVPPDPNSGAAGTVYWTNQALRELGHEVDEIWRDDLPHRIKHGNLHDLLELPRGYRDAVRKRCAAKEYDVIMLSQPHAWLAAKDHRDSGRPGVFINRSHGVEPRVGEALHLWQQKHGNRRASLVRSLLRQVMKHLSKRAWPRCARYCDRFVVPCHDDRNYLIEHLSVAPDKVRTIHHGVHHEFSRQPILPMGEERLKKTLHVAQFAPFKGQLFLAAAVNQLLGEHSELTFSWVCSRKDHAAAMQLFSPAVRGRVQMLDWMPQEVLMDVYDAHGIFLFTTLAEGAAKSSLEALSRGLCVVSYANSGMKDYIADKVSGRLVPTGEVQGLCDASRWFFEDSDRALSCSIAARQYAKNLTWAKCAKEIANFGGAS